MKTVALLLMLALNVTACNPQEEFAAPPAEIPGAPDTPAEPDSPGDPNPPQGNTMRITVNDIAFTATLADPAAARAFQRMLPMTVRMSEMNGNEKYYYLPDDLPAAVFSPGTLQTGDLMLFGTNCLVLFYKPFSTSYGYTRIGRVDDPSQLPAALGAGAVAVKFE